MAGPLSTKMANSFLLRIDLILIEEIYKVNLYSIGLTFLIIGIIPEWF